jgi:hypothetical protein
MRKCIWCSKQSYEVKEIRVLSTNLSAAKRREISLFVCPEHEDRLRGFLDRVRRYALLFICLSVISLLGLVGSTCWRGDNNYPAAYLFLLSVGSIGLVMFIFPFCSPTTLEFMSIATSIKVVRIIGGIIFTLGALGLVLALLYG